jgi:hypothetical protein
MRSAILHGAAALATFALVLASAPDAGAATVLSTVGAPASNDQVPICFITNRDTRPITVTLQLFDIQSGTPVPNGTYTCPLPPATLPPGTGCVDRVAPNAQAYCVVTSSSPKVRAALGLFNGSTAALEVVVPATK